MILLRIEKQREENGCWYDISWEETQQKANLPRKSGHAVKIQELSRLFIVYMVRGGISARRE